jgi:hypothetical protein
MLIRLVRRNILALTLGFPRRGGEPGSGLDLDMKKDYFGPMDRNKSILKLYQADEERELEFELNYLASLTFEERLKMMKQKSREMLRQMVEHGHRRPFEILKRT